MNTRTREREKKTRRKKIHCLQITTVLATRITPGTTPPPNTLDETVAESFW
jgi:hypothetical protein